VTGRWRICGEWGNKYHKHRIIEAQQNRLPGVRSVLEGGGGDQGWGDRMGKSGVASGKQMSRRVRQKIGEAKWRIENMGARRSRRSANKQRLRMGG